MALVEVARVLADAQHVAEDRRGRSQHEVGPTLTFCDTRKTPVGIVLELARAESVKTVAASRIGWNPVVVDIQIADMFDAELQVVVSLPPGGRVLEAQAPIRQRRFGSAAPAGVATRAHSGHVGAAPVAVGQIHFPVVAIVET